MLNILKLSEKHLKIIGKLFNTHVTSLHDILNQMKLAYIISINI